MGDIAAALRSIRGQSGLGCLNKVNGNLANALLSAMNQGKFKVCCGQCHGDSNGDTAARASCAVTLTNPQDISRGTITLNVASNSSTDHQSHCAGRYTGRGLEATLFHELLHTSGVHGFHAHNSSAFNHPVTGIAMDERDVIADPIYGCQNLCYGRTGYNNSTSCLACSLGEPVSGNSAPETTRWDYLNTRLTNAWQLAGAGSPQIPRACMQKWNQGEGEVGRRLANATTSAKHIREQFDLLSACTSRLGNQFRSTRTLVPLLEACAPSFAAIQQKCADFARAVTVVRNGVSQCTTNLYSVHTESIINMCRQGLGDLQTSLATSIRFARDKASVNCNAWYPSTTICPEITASGLSTPRSSQRCLENQATQ